MKKIDWASVTASNGLVFEEQTFEHLNNGHKDSYIAFVKANIPSGWHTGKLVILYGCVLTGTNPGARTLTAGAVYYNDEIYQVDSASFTTTGSQIGIWTITDVDSGTDESTIKTASSSFAEHVLVNSKFVFAAGLSGTGTVNETDVVRFEKTAVMQYNVTSENITSSFVALTSSSYTTANDSGTKKYKLTYTGDLTITLNGNEAAGVEIELYDVTNTSRLRYTGITMNNGTGNAAIQQTYTFTLVWLGSIAPNTNFNVRIKYTGIGSYPLSIGNKTLLIEQI